MKQFTALLLVLLLTACGTAVASEVIVETVVVEVMIKPTREIITTGATWMLDSDGNSTDIQILGGTICELLDNMPVTIGESGRVWYKVDCQGSVGYILVEHSRVLDR